MDKLLRYIFFLFFFSGKIPYHWLVKKNFIEVTKDATVLHHEKNFKGKLNNYIIFLWFQTPHSGLSELLWMSFKSGVNLNFRWPGAILHSSLVTENFHLDSLCVISSSRIWPLGLMATKRNLDIWYEGAVNSTGLHGRRPHIAFLSEAPI